MEARAKNSELYGQTIRQVRLDAFTLTERKYPPFFKTPEHAHKDALFCLVLDGNYTETYGNKNRMCHRQTALFHASDDPHAEHFHEVGGHSFIVEIGHNWISEIRERVSFPSVSADFEHGVLPKLGRKLYREFQTFDELSPIIIEGLILEITGETVRQSVFKGKHTRPDWMSKAENYLEERFAEPFSLKEVANHVQIHPVHLAQTFRKFHQMTVGTYLREIRIERARQDLVNTKKPLTKIAFDTGFSDQSHFSRLFKREFGITPTEFRKQYSST